MNWNKLFRQTHRWVSVAFTVAVLINFVAVVRGKYTSKMGLLAVVPLDLLLVSGLYFLCCKMARWATLRLSWRSSRAGGHSSFFCRVPQVSRLRPGSTTTV